MKEIPLTQGKAAMVDDADFDYLDQWNWYAKRNGKTWYAVRGRHKTEEPGPSHVLMHRILLDAARGLGTDHRNGNGLDNRRANLRPATNSLNQRNRTRGWTNRKHGLPLGVYLTKGRFQAKMGRGKSYRHFGMFGTPEEAHQAYLKGRAKSVAELENDAIQPVVPENPAPQEVGP